MKRKWKIIERLSNGCVNFDVIMWIKYNNISPRISTINTAEGITHKYRNRIILTYDIHKIRNQNTQPDLTAVKY